MKEMKSIKSVDLFKFIAAILVVAIHTLPFYGTSADYYFTCFCRIAVPFFFIATAFFFFRKENPDIRKYTKRLLVLYALWFIIEIPWVYKVFFLHVDYPFYLKCLNLLRCLIFNGTWMSSWYVMACIISVNIVYYLSKCKKWNNKKMLILCGGGYLIALLSSSYYGAFDLLLGERGQSFHEYFTWFFSPANSFVLALIYVTLGKVVAESNWKNWWVCKSKSRTVFLYLVFLTIGVFEVYFMKWSVSLNDAWLFLPPLTLFGFLFLLQTDVHISESLCKWFRNISILVYFLHPIFRLINSRIFGMDFGSLIFAVTLLDSVIVAVIIIALSQKVPILKKLY